MCRRYLFASIVVVFVGVVVVVAVVVGVVVARGVLSWLPSLMLWLWE
jgi:hypothetical protein